MLVLVTDDESKISWWQDSCGNYFRCVNGEYTPLTKLEFAKDIICRFPDSKCIEAGRPE